MTAKATRAREMLMFNDFICSYWLMRQFDLPLFTTVSCAIAMPLVLGRCNAGATGHYHGSGGHLWLPYRPASSRVAPCKRGHGVVSVLWPGRQGCLPLQTGGNVPVVGRCYFNFGKNSAAVLHVAALNSSSEQDFTWAMVLEISIT